MVNRPKRGKYMPLPPRKVAQRQRQMEEQRAPAPVEEEEDEEVEDEEDKEEEEEKEEVEDEEEEDEEEDEEDDEEDKEEEEEEEARSGGTEELESGVEAEEEEGEEEDDDDDDDSSGEENAQEIEEENEEENDEEIEQENEEEKQESSGEEDEDEEEEEEEKQESSGEEEDEEDEEEEEESGGAAMVQEEEEEDDEDEDEEEDNQLGTQEGILDDTLNLSDDDDMEMDFRPPPTPRVPPRRAGPLRLHRGGQSADIDLDNVRDYGRIYTELIDKCQTVEQSSDENFSSVIGHSLEVSQTLFERMTQRALEPRFGSRTGGPGEMYLAFLLTKICSSAMKSRAERIGTGNSIFVLDTFLDGLKADFKDKTGEYSHHLAAFNIATETSAGCRSVHPMVAVVGTFEVGDSSVLTPKPKKVRAPPKRPPPEDMDGEDTGVVEGMPLIQSNPGAENLAKELNKVLKAKYKAQNEPVNLFEFTLDRTSFPRTIENIFYTSFLIKDGHASLARNPQAGLKEFSINLKPEKSERLVTSGPDEEDKSRNQMHRQKHILSFNPRMWKTMCQMSQGDNTVNRTF